MFFVLQKQEVTVVSDLSYGLERHPVPVVVPAECSIPPPDFGYVKESMVLLEESSRGDLWTTVTDAFKAKSGCTGCGSDCLALDGPPCTCVAQSGDLVYSRDGTLQVDVIRKLEKNAPLEFCDEGSGCYCSKLPTEGSSSDEDTQCEGHHPRSFINECNSLCACHDMCGNRVIQHGMMVKVQVRYDKYFSFFSIRR